MPTWIKMENDYKPEIGEKLFSTSSDLPEGLGTLYLCVELTRNSFIIVPIKTFSTYQISEIPKKDQKHLSISFTDISKTNLHREH